MKCGRSSLERGWKIQPVPDFKQEDTGEKLEPTKEARIREILEEFLA